MILFNSLILQTKLKLVIDSRVRGELELFLFLKCPVLMHVHHVILTYHHLSSNPLTLDSNSQPLVVFTLLLQAH